MGRDQRSPEAQAYRKLYKDQRWRGPRGLRLTQLSAEPLCRMCIADGRATAATVADHIVPHRGDEALFFEGELQSLCEPCHSRRKQREEKRGASIGVDVHGYPLT